MQLSKMYPNVQKCIEKLNLHTHTQHRIMNIFLCDCDVNTVIDVLMCMRNRKSKVCELTICSLEM